MNFTPRDDSKFDFEEIKNLNNVLFLPVPVYFDITPKLEEIAETFLGASINEPDKTAGNIIVFNPMTANSQPIVQSLPESAFDESNINLSETFQLLHPRNNKQFEVFNQICSKFLSLGIIQTVSCSFFFV